MVAGAGESQGPSDWMRAAFRMASAPPRHTAPSGGVVRPCCAGGVQVLAINLVNGLARTRRDLFHRVLSLL